MIYLFNCISRHNTSCCCVYFFCWISRNQTEHLSKHREIWIQNIVTETVTCDGKQVTLANSNIWGQTVRDVAAGVRTSSCVSHCDWSYPQVQFGNYSLQRHTSISQHSLKKQQHFNNNNKTFIMFMKNKLVCFH